MSGVADELAQVGFALHGEAATHPRELVRPLFALSRAYCLTCFLRMSRTLLSALMTHLPPPPVTCI